MRNKIKFGSPELISKLDQLYEFTGHKEQEDAKLRGSEDIDNFLKKKTDWQNNSEKADIVFKNK